MSGGGDRIDAVLIDAVLPLRLVDLARARLLFRTLPRVEPLGTLWIVVPDAERRAMVDALPRGSGEIVPESELMPELGLYRRLPGGERRWDWGWQIQQIAKLAIAPRISTPFYLTLDADVLCLRRVRHADLVRGGRAIHVRHEHDLHPEWYRWAEGLLGMKRSGMTHGVTPALLSTSGVLALVRHLEARVSPALRRLGDILPPGPVREALTSWRGYLLRNGPFTEYALYATFMEATGMYAPVHEPVGMWGIYANCAWHPADLETWDPHDAAALGEAWFTVVQSTTGISPEEVERRMGALLRPI